MNRLLRIYSGDQEWPVLSYPQDKDTNGHFAQRVSLAEAYRCGVLAGAEAEREACAKVCEAGINNSTDWDSSYWDQCCENRAAAIRARSQT
jgi:hypothetical protein